MPTCLNGDVGFRMSDFGSVAGQRFYPKSEIRHPKSTWRRTIAMMKTPPTSRHDIRNTTTMPRISRDSFRPASTGMSDFGSVAGQRFYPKSEIRHPKSTRRSPEPIPRYNLSMATEVRRYVRALDCPDAAAILVTGKDGVATQLRA